MVKKLVVVVTIFLVSLLSTWLIIFLIGQQAHFLADFYNMSDLVDAYFLSVMIMIVPIGFTIGITAEILNR